MILISREKYQSIEKWTGNIIAAILVLLFLTTIVVSLFRIMFRDGRGAGGIYGNRGNVYIYDDYNGEY
jgi:hypothetical protein